MTTRHFVATVLLSLCAGAAHGGGTCLENAATQREMNVCTELSYEAVDKELHRIYHDIERLYADDRNFLAALRKSQQAWLASRDADLDAMFPAEDKQLQYGSAYPMCVSNLKIRLAIQRIAFLKQWLAGREEGEVCSGSVKRLDDSG